MIGIVVTDHTGKNLQGHNFLHDAGKDATRANDSVRRKARRGRHTKQAVEEMLAAESAQSVVSKYTHENGQMGLVGATSISASDVSSATQLSIQTGNAGVDWELHTPQNASPSEDMRSAHLHSQHIEATAIRSDTAQRYAGQSKDMDIDIHEQVSAVGTVGVQTVGQQHIGAYSAQSNMHGTEPVERVMLPVSGSSDSSLAKGVVTPTILFVCHGNICRSVTGEYMLRHAALQYGKRVSSRKKGIDRIPDIDTRDETVATDAINRQSGCIIRSCGLLRHMHGSAAEPTVVRLLQERGIDASDSHSQFIQARDLQEATLVLCFSRQQISELTDIEPRAARKIFLIDEFAMLCQTAEREGYIDQSNSCVQRLQQIFVAVPLLRPVIGVGQGVEDPFGKEYDVFVDSVNRIENSVRTIARVLFA